MSSKIEEVNRLQAEAMTLQREIDSQAQSLEGKKARLAQIQRTCQHKWSPVKYEPIYQEGYTIPGDPPGTMGIDWRGPCHVPSKTTKQWSRHCPLCDKKELTQRTRKEHVAGPIAGTGGEVEVPDFGDKNKW